MVVCYSVVWYCMVGDGMVWVLTIDGCSLHMGAKPLYTYCMPIVYKSCPKVLQCGPKMDQKAGWDPKMV